MRSFCFTGIEVPGTIKVFNRDGTIKDVVTFPAPTEYTTLRENGVFDPKGNRVTKLGTSMFVFIRKRFN